MMQFPSGAITGMGVSAKERLVGVISEDGGCAAGHVCECFTSSYTMYICTAGGITVYNYEMREDVCRSKFTGGGASLLWAPQQVMEGRGGEGRGNRNRCYMYVHTHLRMYTCTHLQY